MGQRGSWRLAALVAALACDGCAHHPGLVPDPQATVVPDNSKTAYDQADGVVVFVNGDAWKSNPRDLADVMTPIKVTVRNERQSRIRIGYKDFALKTSTGLSTNPLPPFSINAPGPSRTAVISSPGFFYDRFFVAPAYHRFYPGLATWGGGWALDPALSDQYYLEWQVPLPTEDMLRQAIPEGVLEPGGSVTGFLYFPKVRDKGTVTFRASLPETPAGTQLAAIDIPLRVK
jgi:hypothetical protein